MLLHQQFHFALPKGLLCRKYIGFITDFLPEKEEKIERKTLPQFECYAKEEEAEVHKEKTFAYISFALVE